MTKEERIINNLKRVRYLEFMADGIKARLQRFNLFNTKQEQKYVSLFGVKDCRSVLFSFRVMLSGKLTLAHSRRSEHRALKLASLVSINVIFYSLYKFTFHTKRVCVHKK